MPTDTVNNCSAFPQQKDFYTNPSDPAHRAIESLLNVFKEVPEYMDTHAFLDICSALDGSSAFDQFVRDNPVDYVTAAKLLLAGLFYHELVARWTPEVEA